MDSNDVKDMISYVLISTDGTCLCLLVDGNVFPLSFPATDKSWVSQTVEEIKKNTGLEVTDLKLFKCYKIGITKAQYISTYVLSLVFQGIISSEQKQKCNLKPGYTWLSLENLVYLYQNCLVASDILIEMFPKVADGEFSYDKYHGEFSVFGSIVEISSTGYHFRHAAIPEIHFNSLLSEQINNLFYKDFFAMCLPSVLMSLYHFTEVMTKFDVKPAVIPLLFKACDDNSNLFISFCDLVYLLCAMDPNIEHIGQAAIIRKRYVFKMYANSSNLLLSYSDLEKLINYVRTSGDHDTKTCIEMLKMSSRTKKLSLNEFMRAVDDLHLKGWAFVLRTNKPFLSIYSNSNDIVEDKKRNEEFAQLQNEEMATEKNHELALHTLTVIKNGNLINMEDIWTLKEAASDNTLHLANITHEARRLSCEINSPTILYNQLIRDLRLLTYSAGRRKSIGISFNWGNVNSKSYANRLIQAAGTLKKLVSAEPRVLPISSPVLVIGSLLGNYGLLSNHERLFWPRCPGFCPGTILFLGNYTTKMQFGLEVISYLFCYKTLYPQKICLLRGYYENRHIPEKEPFYEECIRKFGMKLGNQVWDAVQQVFDCLPFAATVDGKILCLAGGIPHPSTSTLLEALNSVPVPMAHPQNDSKLAWEVLCNAPITVNATADNEPTTDGFKNNNKLGAYYFNDDAVCKFLDTNCYSHLITLDESIIGSLELKANCRMICCKTFTINNGWDTTCFLLDEGIIRPIQCSI